MNGVTGVQTNQPNTNTSQTQALQSSAEFLQALITSLTMLESTASNLNSNLSGLNSTTWPGVLLPLEVLGANGGTPLALSSAPSLSGVEQVNAGPGQAVIPSASQGSVAGLGAIVNQASALYHVPASLIRGVIQQESANNPNSVSPAGAMGLMQLMPENVQALGVTNPFDPTQNVMAGTRLLAGLLDHYKGNPSLALAAYNAGEGAVAKYNGIPPYPETQQYVQKVLTYAEQYAASGNV